MASFMVFCLVLPAGIVTALKGKWGTLAVGVVWPVAWVGGAVRLAKPESRWGRKRYDEDKRRRAAVRAADRRQLRLAAAALAASTAPLVFFALAWKAYRIPSPAMEPTLRCGEAVRGCTADENDRVFAFRYVLGRRPERSDIVAVRSDARFERRCGSSGVFVRRVVGLPGDVVETRDGVPVVNGTRIVLPGADRSAGTRGGVDSIRPVRVPSGHYFLVGDYSAASCDSRFTGPIAAELVVAEVVAVYWPPGRVGRP